MNQPNKMQNLHAKLILDRTEQYLAVLIHKDTVWAGPQRTVHSDGAGFRVVVHAASHNHSGALVIFAQSPPL